MNSDAPPHGVVAVFIDESGRVIAHAADFERAGYGGYTLREAQEMRAKRQLAYAVANVYASPAFVRALRDYQAEEMMTALVRQHGCRTHVIHVGEGQ